jgi:hypothetical protein
MNNDASIDILKKTQKLLDEAPVSAPGWAFLYNRKTAEIELIACGELTDQKLLDMGYDLKHEE